MYALGSFDEKYLTRPWRDRTPAELCRTSTEVAVVISLQSFGMTGFSLGPLLSVFTVELNAVIPSTITSVLLTV